MCKMHCMYKFSDDRAIKCWGKNKVCSVLTSIKAIPGGHMTRKKNHQHTLPPSKRGCGMLTSPSPPSPDKALQDPEEESVGEESLVSEVVPLSL